VNCGHNATAGKMFRRRVQPGGTMDVKRAVLVSAED